MMIFKDDDIDVDHIVDQIFLKVDRISDGTISQIELIKVLQSSSQEGGEKNRDIQIITDLLQKKELANGIKQEHDNTRNIFFNIYFMILISIMIN